MVTWSTWIPRSVSNSSTSRYDSGKRRYQRTASTMTSGGKQKPAKADGAIGVGPGRRVVMATVCVPWLAHSRCNSALRRHPGEPAVQLEVEGGVRVERVIGGRLVEGIACAAGLWHSHPVRWVSTERLVIRHHVGH